MNLGVDYPKPVVVAGGLCRGHLNPAVTTIPMFPEGAACVIAANTRPFGWCRAVGIPVIHLVTSSRDTEEIRDDPF